MNMNKKKRPQKELEEKFSYTEKDQLVTLSKEDYEGKSKAEISKMLEDRLPPKR